MPPPTSAVLTFTGDAEGLREELEQLRAGGLCRCVVLLAAGDSASAAGAGMADDWRWLERYELPTIFAFEDQLEGTALEIALSCDIRICGGGASIRSRNPGRRRLLQLIGAEASLEFIGLRGLAPAETALRWGLVSELTAAGEAKARARALASTIATRGPIATRLAKEASWRGLEMPLEQALRFETDLTLLLQTTKDRAEGVRAFIEKRAPTFAGE